jgi:hypothetical protein
LGSPSGNVSNVSGDESVTYKITIEEPTHPQQRSIVSDSTGVSTPAIYDTERRRYQILRAEAQQTCDKSRELNIRSISILTH